MIQPDWNNHSNSSAKEMTEGKREEVAVLTLTPPNIAGVILQSISGFIQPSPHNVILLLFLFFSFFCFLFPVAISSFHLPHSSSPAVWGSSSSTFSILQATLRNIRTLVDFQAANSPRKMTDIYSYLFFLPFLTFVFQCAHPQLIVSTCNYMCR